MSAVNVESRNAMATKRVIDYPSAYMNHQHGLIKSASTSSCSAHENALLKTLRASRYATNGKKNGFGEVGCNERLKLFVLQPFSHSEQNMLAAERDALLAGGNGFYQSHGGASRHKAFYSNSKHLGDWAAVDCNSVAGRVTAENVGACTGYSSHRSLDNVLINKSNNSAILNFAAVNGYHGNHNNCASELRSLEAAVTTTPVSKSSQESRCVDKRCDISQTKLVAADSPTAPVPKITVSRSTPPFQLPKSSTIQTPTTAHSATPSANVPASQTVAKGADSSASSTTNSVTSSKDCTPEPSISCSSDEEHEPSKKEKLCRRSSSLKMPKESATNPAQKKIVRFADAMGLDLTDVRTFLDELPSVPKSAYNDLQASSNLDLRNSSKSPVTDKLFGGVAPTAPAKSLVPMFKQPSISHNFLERIRDQNVCLEKAVVNAQPMCNIAGTVRVRNIDFHKSVFVRYTLDNWRTFGEVQAVYVPDSCDGFSDQFSFIIYLYELPSSQRVELAVRYHCSGTIFWDNNLGANYVFQTSSSPPIIPSYFACVQTSTDRCHSFY